MTTFDLSEQLTRRELEELEDEMKLIRLYEMRTSLHPRFTVDDQARDLGVSVRTIKRWAKGEPFQRVVAAYAPKTRTPMVDVAMEHLNDELLPKALQGASEILDNPRTPATAKVTLIGLIMRYAFEIQQGEGDKMDQEKAIDFLTKRGLEINNINVVINQATAPQDFRDALQSILPGEIVDGEVG